MTALRYSFDTSSLLNGRRDLLPPEVFPTLWAKIEQSISDGVIRAVDVVRDELGKRDDATMAWATAQSGLFLTLDADIQRSTSNTLVSCPRLMGRGGGRNAADPFVIGLARARGCIVVTEETPSGRLDRPRIPPTYAAPLVSPASTSSGSSRTRAGRSDTASPPDGLPAQDHEFPFRFLIQRLRPGMLVGASTQGRPAWTWGPEIAVVLSEARWSQYTRRGRRS